MKSVSSITKLKAVLWKSYLIKRKTPKTSLFELFFPVILLAALVQMRDNDAVAKIFNSLLSLNFSIVLSGLMSLVVTEREQRMAEMMRILGLSTWVHYLSWFLFYAGMMVIMSVSVAAVMVFGGVLAECSFVIVSLFYIVYSTSAISFSLLLSTPFDSSKTAQTVGFLIYVMISMFGSLIDPKGSAAMKNFICFVFPPLAYQMGSNRLTSANAEEGVNFKTLFDAEQNVSVGSCMLMMSLSTVVFFFLYMYLDQVLPHAVGTRRPWSFPVEFFFSKKISDARESSESQELMGEPNVVEVKSLTKRYDASRLALSDVTMTLRSGELTVLLGRNGAGKTTLINILTGMTEATSGTARVLGYSVSNRLAEVRENIGFCPQHDIQWPQLTVKEHFEIFGAFRGVDPAVISERMTRLLSSLGLTGKEKAPASTLSGGMKRKLSVGLAFLGDSKFVILDEPTSGLDPLSRRHMWTVLGRLREDRVLLLSTHYMDEAEVLGEKVVILSDGVVRANGSVNELKREFDCGYDLIVKPKGALEIGKLEKTVRAVIESGKVVLGEDKKSAVISVPVDATPLIPSLLEELRDKFDRQIEIISKRLEEVFMRIALDGSVEEIVVPPSPEDCVESDEEEGLNPKSKTHQQIKYVSSGMPLMVSQVKGTAMKRFLMFIREIHSSLLVNLFPVLMIAIGFMIAKTQRDKMSSQGEDDFGASDLITGSLMIMFVQIAFSSISTGIVTSLSRETASQSKFLQYVAGLMPVAYWTGTFVGDLTEYFTFPFASAAIMLSLVDAGIPMAPLLSLLAAFGPAVVAQTYALTVLFTNPAISKLISFAVNSVIGIALPMLFNSMRFQGDNSQVVNILVPIFRVFPSFNLGDGLTGIILNSIFQDFASKDEHLQEFFEEHKAGLPGYAKATSLFSLEALGTPILCLLVSTPLLLGIAIYVDDLRYRHKTDKKLKFTPPPQQAIVEDESVVAERAKVTNSEAVMAMRVVNVSKQWAMNGPLAVNRVPLGVARNGEIFTVLGENGAGKTTLLTMAIGQILPSDGDIYIDRFNTKTQLKEARQLIGYCPQFDAILLQLTVKDHLRLFARIKGMEPDSIELAVRRTIEWLGLRTYENTKAKALSGGYKRRLSLAIALMGQPEILILDEPSCGMDPVARRQMWQVMESASRDCAVILTTHSMEEAEAVSTRLGIMSRGHMVCLGSAEQLRHKFSNGVEVFAQTKEPEPNPTLMEQVLASRESFEQMCQRHSAKRASRFVSSGLNIMMKEKSDQLLVLPFVDWWCQENLTDELEQSIMTQIQGVSNFEASGRSVRFVVEPSDKLVTIDFIGKIFTFLERAKNSGSITDYSVTQNSLDQVFRSIASRELQAAAYAPPAVIMSNTH